MIIWLCSVLKTYLRAREKNSVPMIRLIPTLLVIEVVLVFTNIDKNVSLFWFCALTKLPYLWNTVTQECISNQTWKLNKKERSRTLFLHSQACMPGTNCLVSTLPNTGYCAARNYLEVQHQIEIWLWLNSHRLWESLQVSWSGVKWSLGRQEGNLVQYDFS